ncbi:P60-like protein [Pleomassaria siparia CBS 279.74]|uniref:Ribosome biogenesis protein NOP53 n=1 Tax=Pleomassaria siparia CBS 279.74 TaxID=1314801 RepID=A0A6G1K8U8_9PLEO|nr:P60-like protein [Pleomassaria siparia CBS 279.74]
MATTEAAPAQYKQPSRKGKKAWRKNVDVTQVQDGLEEVRDQIIQGGVISEKTADQLFAIDTSGSPAIAKAYNKRNKPLKVDEILAQRSAIPAVGSRKRLAEFNDPRSNKKRLSYKEYDKLRAVAYGGDQVQKDIVKIGDPADHDPWATEETNNDPKTSFLDPKFVKREPVTLKQAPVSLSKSGKPIPAVRKPDAGRSYNPLVSDWVSLYEREGEKEIEAEKKRLKEAEEEAAAMERAIAAAEEAEQESDNNESAWESEWEGFSDAENNSLKVKRPERKTPAQRNKIKRRKEAERKAVHDAKVKAKEQQLQHVKQLAKSIKEKESARAAALAAVQQVESSDEEGEEVLRRKRFGRHPIPAAPLEVVLPDELQDSLRRLKPEGNLLHDRMRNMIVNGKVESRRQIAFHKQAKTTVTEKWSYKDWTLDKL